MSSGEADVWRNLDAYRQCATPGCPWQVFATETSCEKHGGKAVPQYATTGEGDVIAVKFVTWSDDFNGDAA